MEHHRHERLVALTKMVYIIVLGYVVIQVIIIQTKGNRKLTYATFIEIVYLY